MLGVSVGTIQLWVESGLLEAWKTGGGHRRVVRGSIERLLHKPERQPAIAAPTQVPVSHEHALNIMVVEDDPALLRLYQTVIANWALPCNLVCIDNAIEALLVIGRGGPDLLITDLHMPELDGFEMLRVLEKSPEVRETTIVVVSGLDAADIASRGGVPVGVTVLPKPVPFGRLLDLATTLSRSRKTA